MRIGEELKGESVAQRKKQELYLLGQPQLSEFIDFVSRSVIDGDAISKRGLVDMWRAANDHYGELEESEAGLADRMDIRPLPPEMMALKAEAEQDPRYLRAFDKLPTTFEMVELDKLVLYQIRVTKSHSDGRRVDLPRRPAPGDLFRFCLPMEMPEAPVESSRYGNKFVFVSPSTDFQKHRPALFEPGQISDYLASGSVAAMVGLSVGYGSNFFTGIRYGNRVILNNGYHRAYAMRAAGITHAPCIVETATRMDELRLVASSSVLGDTGFYLEAPRPPLLKDFFDDRIARSFDVIEKRKVIEVTIESKEYWRGV